MTARRRHFLSHALTALVAGALLAGCAPAKAESVVRLPAATLDPAVTAKRATAVLAGGCFWGVEGVFSNVKGVISVESGYHGGGAATARYELTHDGTSGHAEAVRIVYDPTQVSYGTLLRILFSVVADPTLKNRQGPDVGTQYRAAIVPMDAVQRQVATAYLAQIGKGKYFARPVVVPVESYKRFYRAEPNHQDFMRRNPANSYIVRWDAPKLAALKRLYPALVRGTPAP
ncbi:peptide-methionine (S)-S-oxide reductase MsrA [Sphingopyxis macrogoltabida]|uniref:Peptide methionine sulfoxide reductase MsrA n=1 Tax=Sphingopyxis macrogoltabida TaxID=33050 RepID=A0AAC9FG93_SPHMC|nr:peptide-methionine (S)-S-oxide reductase MsrA [Sphingopyxis macrogoltabida]ALJ15053.1 methionine sulfoxide reductase A [Sphingopyxis macrogoltabida]AMU91301.1 methionine sulfoxide reductase A [Sphingopyxis macrogoltabida]